MVTQYWLYPAWLHWCNIDWFFVDPECCVVCSWHLITNLCTMDHTIHNSSYNKLVCYKIRNGNRNGAKRNRNCACATVKLWVFYFVLHEKWWMWRYRAELAGPCIQLQKLQFVDFDPHIVARYLATIADVRPNLITVCLSVSLIGTGLLANTPVFIYVYKFINNNNSSFEYSINITSYI